MTDESATPPQLLTVEVTCVAHGVQARFENDDPDGLRESVRDFLSGHGDCMTSIDLSGARGVRLLG